MKITEVEKGLSNLELNGFCHLDENDMLAINGGQEASWCICFQNHSGGCIRVQCGIRIGCDIRMREFEELETDGQSINY